MASSPSAGEHYIAVKQLQDELNFEAGLWKNTLRSITANAQSLLRDRMMTISHKIDQQYSSLSAALEENADSPGLSSLLAGLGDFTLNFNKLLDEIQNLDIVPCSGLEITSGNTEDVTDGCVMEVVVTSPMDKKGIFWIQQCMADDVLCKLKAFSRKLKVKLISSPENLQHSSEVKAGDRVCAFVVWNQMWYRAVIEEVQDEMHYVVRLLDYGIKETVARSFLVLDCSDFCSDVPFQAHRCKLESPQQHDGDISLDARWYFNDLTLCKEFTCKFVTSTEENELCKLWSIQLSQSETYVNDSFFLKVSGDPADPTDSFTSRDIRYLSADHGTMMRHLECVSKKSIDETGEGSPHKITKNKCASPFKESVAVGWSVVYEDAIMSDVIDTCLEDFNCCIQSVHNSKIESVKGSPGTCSVEGSPGTCSVGGTPSTWSAGGTPGSCSVEGTPGTWSAGATPGICSVEGTPGTWSAGATPGICSVEGTPGTWSAGATPGTCSVGSHDCTESEGGQKKGKKKSKRKFKRTIRHQQLDSVSSTSHEDENMKTFSRSSFSGMVFERLVGASAGPSSDRAKKNEARCFSCNQLGHMMRFCPSRTRHE